MTMAQDTKLIDADVSTAFGTVHAVRRTWSQPIDVSAVPEGHWLELSLLPRSREARGCFPEEWGPHRFERIGELFLFPAGRPVHAKSECLNQSSVTCVLQPEAIRGWFDTGFEWTDHRLRGTLDIASPFIRSLVFRLGEEIRNPGFASETLIELMIGQIAIELGRHFTGIEADRAVGGLAPWRLRLIDERLAQPIESPSLIELAELCGLSVRQLARGFRTSRGCSIGTHIAATRVETAKLLLASDHCVKTIAHRLGFSSPSNFSVAFRRATGEAPRDYRQRVGRLPTGPSRLRH